MDGDDKKKQQNLGHRERLKARFAEAGPNALPDYELLELLLFQAIPRIDVKPLAKDLLKHFGSFGDVISADPERLAQIKGIGPAAIHEMKVVQAAALLLARGRIMDQPVLSSWQDLLDYCRAAMGYNKTEQFRVLFLNKKNALITDEVQQKGTVDHTPVYPREVAKRSLELDASAIILVHNHPSGDPTPSRADIEMTKQIVDACKAVGIIVHDHLIIGKNEHTSFRSQGLI